MQLYHHPYSMDSQKVRLVLEEKSIDYTSYHVNPLTGKNMNASFFRMNPSAKLPVFQNGSHILFRAIDIVQYIDRLTASLSGQAASVSTETAEWIQKIENWDPKIFTLAHTPPKYRNFISKFIRRVIIARMSEFPDLASMYHIKLREAYETEDKLKNQDAVKQSEDELCAILDEAELQLEKTMYLAGEEFTLADSMFIPVLVRLSLLKLEEQYINTRPNVLVYYNMVKKRPSYKIVIGKYFGGWRKYCTLYKTASFLLVRKTLRRY
ncbi:glutathione S-transferase family protein [Carex rostrata]